MAVPALKSRLWRFPRSASRSYRRSSATRATSRPADVVDGTATRRRRARGLAASHIDELGAESHCHRQPAPVTGKRQIPWVMPFLRSAMARNLRSLQIPDADVSIGRIGGQTRPVRRRGERMDLPVVRGKRPAPASRRGFPQFELSVAGRRGDQLSRGSHWTAVYASFVLAKHQPLGVTKIPQQVPLDSTHVRLPLGRLLLFEQIGSQLVRTVVKCLVGRNHARGMSMPAGDQFALFSSRISHRPAPDG